MTLQKLVAWVGLNLVPLQYNTFTNCKSELKYFEAAIVGTQTIASPTYTYARAIQDGENGYLAQAHQWLNRIRHAAADAARFSTMAECSYHDAPLGTRGRDQGRARCARAWKCSVAQRGGQRRVLAPVAPASVVEPDKHSIVVSAATPTAVASMTTTCVFVMDEGRIS